LTGTALTKYYRNLSEPLNWQYWKKTPPGIYNIYPSYRIGAGKVHNLKDHMALRQRMVGHKRIAIDGYSGVAWGNLRADLSGGWSTNKRQWIPMRSVLRPSEEIEAMVAPYLGGDDPLFGKRYSGTIEDFYDLDKLRNLVESSTAETVIVYGPGAALAFEDSYLIYVDVPKNVIQYGSRVGGGIALGQDEPTPPSEMYKRYYFVDWVVLNRHKAKLLPQIDLFVDRQDGESPVISGDDLRQALTDISRSCFRVLPWFEPGPWGGQWMKQHFPQLEQDVPNYAWSFEMIAPEQGIVLKSGSNSLEVSFDLLMYHNHRAVLGDYADRFGYEFPIRFDFLDTFDGGNLSVQCHPRPSFIREQFGETFTQDETYYILDCEPDAEVYLGFQEDIDPQEFRAALEHSVTTKTELDIERYVQKMPSEKHKLFLIPNGTIHCSGVDNMVLEISATPYIFTFKMYDWLRLDLNGNPRPLNIERAFQNLYFDRKGVMVEQDLIAHPYTIDAGKDWRLVHLPTHRAHFYDVHRIEFDSTVTVQTNGSPHLLMLVEGTSMLLKTANGHQQRFAFAETIVIPAAAGSYTLINESGSTAKVIKAFMKPDWSEPAEPAS
jgi:mannose-6-phosphate isomerase class I